MRKSRKLPQLILFLLLLTQTLCAQNPTASSSGPSNDYGIDPDKQYPGSMVLELMQESESEIDSSVDEAYGEGYKAATLRYSPELEKYKHLYQDEKAKTTVSKKILAWACCFLAGFAGGAITLSLVSK